jgi:probable F420-dependent oxidoreductase
MKFALASSFAPIAVLPSFATAADESGWDMIAMPDHVVNPKVLRTPYPYTADGARRWPEFTNWPDQLVMMGAFAAMTKRIRFTTTAFVLPMRSPFLVAKAFATLSVISNNRAVLTAAVGWSRDEFEIMDQDFSTRGKRADEMVEVMRLLWSGEYVEHSGKFYNFPLVEMNPKPAGHIPIWFAGVSDAALQRTARLGEGWLSEFQTEAEILAQIKQLRQLRREYGRDHLPFEILAAPSDVFDLDGYRRLEEHGITHVLRQPWMLYHPGTKDPAVMIDDIRRFADEVIVKLQ